MAFIPALNTLRVSLEFTLNGEICVNVMYANKTTTIISTDLETLATAIVAWWDTVIALFPSTFSLSKVSLRDMTVQGGQILDFTETLPLAGTQAVSSVPNNVAVVVSWRTGISGRSFRGRTFIAGLATGGIVDNVIDSGSLADLAGAWADLSVVLSTAPFTHVVASFQHLGAPRSTATLTPITHLTINSRPDTQRRREPAVD